MSEFVIRFWFNERRETVSKDRARAIFIANGHHFNYDRFLRLGKIRRKIKMRWIAGLLALGSFVCYVLGITLPAFQIKKLFLFKQNVTILNSVWLLMKHGEFFLSTIILVFSILFPLVKYSMLLVASVRSGSENVASVVGALSKWAMLDVYVIALFVMTFKMGKGIIAVEVKMGTIFFTISVVTSLIASTLSKRA